MIQSGVAGPTPSSLFYPVSGMPLALAMFGVSLTLYIVMAAVRMCLWMWPTMVGTQVRLYVCTGVLALAEFAKQTVTSGE